MTTTTPSAGRARQERILVVCTQYIGDTLLAIPFLRNLRAAHPDAVIDVCAEGGPRAVLAHCPYVNERVSWNRPPRDRRGGLTAIVAGLRAQAAWLRSRGYTRSYLLKPSVSAAVLAFLAGIPVRVGFAGESSPLLTRRVRRRPGRHQVETYLDLLRGEAIPLDDGRNENWIPNDAAARIAPLVERFPLGRQRVFLAIQSTDLLKHWPAERWERLVAWLVTERNCEVVLCGGPRDVPAHDAIREALPSEVVPHVHDYSEFVPLADAAALMRAMDVCVGVDTGLVHMAASVGVPVAVIVGPTDPNRWAPWRTRSHVLRSSRVTKTITQRLRARAGVDRHLRWPLGRADADDISYDDVQRAVADLLQSPGTRRLDLTAGGFRYEVVAGRSSSQPRAVPVAG